MARRAQGAQAAVELTGGAVPIFWTGLATKTLKYSFWFVRGLILRMSRIWITILFWLQRCEQKLCTILHPAASDGGAALHESHHERPD